MGFRHPAKRQWRTVLKSLPSTIIFIFALFLLWHHYRFFPLLVWSVAGIVYLAGILNSSIRDLIQVRLMRPDLFVGYSFSTAVGSSSTTAAPPLLSLTAEVSPLVIMSAAFLWPTWGVVSIIPPKPPNEFSASRESLGFRGAQWPFVLRARNDNEWKECAQRLISNCKLAVFDMRQRPGEGLNWEIEQATLLIGENQIARIENDDKGYVVLRVAGILHPPPPYIKDYALSEEEFKGQFETLCAIRSWVASSLPVFGRDLFFSATLLPHRPRSKQNHSHAFDNRTFAFAGGDNMGGKNYADSLMIYCARFLCNVGRR